MAYITSTEFLNSPYGAEYQPSGSIFATTADVDSFLQYISDLIDLYCGRTFDVKTYTDTFEGQGSTVHMLRVFPIASLTSVDYDDISSTGTVSLSNFRAQETGLLKSKVPFLFGRTYTITYDAGYAVTPQPIKQAALMLANTYAQAIDAGAVGQADGGSSTSFKFGKFQETYIDPRQRNVSYVEGIPPTVEAILRRYKYLKV